MSVLVYPEANQSDIQIWNNAAFDESEDSNLIVKSSSINPCDSFDSFSSKENQTPRFVKSSAVTVQPPATVPFRPLNPNTVFPIGNNGIGNSAIKKPIKPIQKVDEKNIDEEIEEIQSEISRLASRLEVLWLEKAKNVEKNNGRPVAAKFTDQKLGGGVGKNREVVRKVEERLGSRRGFSMGPTEIMSVGKLRQPGFGKQEITPFQTVQSRRKSCFWKLQDIEEENLSKGGRRGSTSRLSLSPKSRKSIGKVVQSSRQAVTTVGSKKGLKKEDGVLTMIQPKKLFMKDGEKSVPAKKVVKPGRVVASRYTQSIANNSVMRKRSLPENEKDEGKGCDKKRPSSVGKSRGTEGRVKKRWEIPSEIVVPKKLELDDKSPPGTSALRGVLPRIRAVRCANDTPRDSGPAKRVAELIGRKSFFGDSDEVVEPSICQALSFAEEFEEEDEKMEVLC